MKTTSHKILFLLVAWVVGTVVTTLWLGYSQPPFVLAQDSGIAPGETAQTSPKNRDTTVTATVPDSVAPSAPVLIAPENTSSHSGSPNFSWFPSTDNVGVTSYQLTLDGTVYFSSIPVVTTTTSTFTLTYHSTTQSYELNPSANLSDGTHTWKITAVDSRGNTADSTTWTFTLDTMVPTFVITTIDTTTAAISAQDTETIPIEPVELSNNEASLSGTGEANATVQMTITWGDESVETTFTISSSGEWTASLPLIPRDTTIYASFLVTDAVGNVSILERIPMVLPSQKIVVPGLPGEEITIPTDARELLLNLGALAIEALPLSLRESAPLPEPIATIVITTRNITQPIATLLFVSVAPVIAVVTLVAPFGAGVSASLIQQALYALGYLPTRKKQGLVFDSADQSPIALATLTLTGKTAAGKRVHLVVFSATDGMYPPFNPGYGTYSVTVAHQHFIFPTLEKRPAHLTVTTMYQGETFTIDRYHPEPGLLIPLERVSEDTVLSKDHLKLTIARLSQYKESFGVFSWVFMTVVTTLQPSYINTLTLGSFTTVLVLRALAFQKKTVGFTVDTNNTPVRNVIIESVTRETGVVDVITQSQRGGKFQLAKLTADQELVVVDIGRKWSIKEAQAVNEDIRNNAKKLHSIVLEPIIV